MIVRAFRQYTSKHPVLSRPCSPEEMRRTVAEHRAIHEALANRDAGLASDRMHAPNEYVDPSLLLRAAEATAYLWDELAAIGPELR